jgi:NAD(P)H dehydrogenase (quinone)
MRVLTVFAHPDRRSFCGAVLDRFQDGLKEAGHDVDVADLYAERFNPVFGALDGAFFADDSVPIVGPEKRQEYLDEAYRLGRGYAD